jgi:tetratricopeptide (TPR) repeat protein
VASELAETRVIERRAVASVAPSAVGSLEGVDPRWVELNNEAIGWLSAGEFERAAQSFERCLTAEPERAVFRRNLAETLVRLARLEKDERRELADAIAHLERAAELAPEREDLDAIRELAQSWRTELELERGFDTRDSDYFELAFDTERRDLVVNGSAVLTFLERAYADLRDWFGIDPVFETRARKRLRVVIYNREEFDRMTGLGHWAGGVYDGTLRIAVEDLIAERERWERVMRHELVHAFVNELGGADVPGWLNEGLAQWLELGVRPSAARAAAVALARERLGAGALLSLADLTCPLAELGDPARIAQAYAQSLAFVDFLRSSPNAGDAALQRMVRGAGDVEQAYRLASGAPLAAAFEDFALSLARAGE